MPKINLTTNLGFLLIVIMILGLVKVAGYNLQDLSTWALDPVADLQQQIDGLEKLKKLSEDATKPLENELDGLVASINSARAGIDLAKKQATQAALEIKQRELELMASYQLFSKRVLEQYKRGRMATPFLAIIASDTAGELTKDLAYRSSIKAQDRQLVQAIGADIVGLERDKLAYEERQVVLAGLEKQLDSQAVFFKAEIAKAKNYQQKLSSQIAELSAKQQEILSQKSSTFQTTVGDVPLADDPASRPDYNPGFSPAFAAFSFGAPHFRGMSQYGALGRAKSGQSYEQILKAYYGGGIEIKDHNPDAQITVTGYGTYSLEEYAKRIYEVPGSWGDEGGMEALKAQAIAARSYALARGSAICATEACQVFKPNPKGGNWERAVNETRGKVVYANGSPFSTWYASTSGGYQESYSGNGHSTPGFWDTQNGQAGWTSSAYEKIAESPWFYKGWYKSRGGVTCGRSHPWLTGEEMADVINAWVVIIKHGQSDDRVTPAGGCWGGNPYSMNELKDKANGLGGGYSKVSSVSVTYSSSGVTAEVRFETDRGGVTIKGSEFHKAFNLRAPGRIALKSGLFNIEQK
jgi:peptidoglycan hydrolase-like amidase